MISNESLFSLQFLIILWHSSNFFNAWAKYPLVIWFPLHFFRLCGKQFWHAGFTSLFMIFFFWWICQNCEQILEKTDYTMISGNPFIKKSGNTFNFLVFTSVFYSTPMLYNFHLFLQDGGRYHFSLTSPTRSKTNLLNLMIAGMFCELNLWFGRTCSMCFGSCN